MKPLITFEDGLEETIDWIRDNKMNNDYNNYIQMNNYIISKYKSIRDALTQLEKNDQKCLIAVDENKNIWDFN